LQGQDIRLLSIACAVDSRRDALYLGIKLQPMVPELIYLSKISTPVALTLIHFTE
jgi:hypothetical protein